MYLKVIYFRFHNSSVHIIQLIQCHSTTCGPPCNSNSLVILKYHSLDSYNHLNAVANVLLKERQMKKLEAHPVTVNIIFLQESMDL